MRAIFVSGVAAALVATWALMLRAGMLFQEFSITSCLDDLGNPPEDYAIPALGIKPFGLACLLLMIYGYGCLKYYQCWVTAAAKKTLEEDGGSEEAELASLSVAKQQQPRQPNGDQGNTEGSEVRTVAAPFGC